MTMRWPDIQPLTAAAPLSRLGGLLLPPGPAVPNPNALAPLLLSWQVWALLSALFATVTALLAKLGVAGIPSNLATLLRTLVVLALLLAVVLGRGELTSLALLPRRSLVFLVLSGLATGVSWLCYFRALSLGPVSGVAPIDKLSVVAVALLGVLWLGESLAPWQWLGVGLMGVGAALLALP
jgi:transporter family protein